MSQLHPDLSRLAVVHTDELTWKPSPSPTVWRKRLDLRGHTERGRVTSVVRYDRGSLFPPHGHPEGEEFLVLEGIFSDEHGDYPAGTYVLNPPGFEHAPYSREGCIIFVKLRQYAGPDRKHVVVDMNTASWTPHQVAGVETLTLYTEPDHPETVSLVRANAAATLPPQQYPGGGELFVVTGGFRDEQGENRTGSWVRYPPGSEHTPQLAANTVVYLKQGHLVGV